MRYANIISILALILAGGCAADTGRTNEGLGEVCEPDHVRPLYDVETGTIEAGTAVIHTADGTVSVHLTAAEGWQLGDFHVRIGPSADELTDYVLNPEPWIDGYVSELSVTVPWDGMGVTCGDQVKVIIQGHEVDDTGRIFVSALGDGDRGQWGWIAWYDLCCEPQDVGCTLTQGYWKTHPDAWPVTSLRLGDRIYTQDELLGLLHTAPRGDSSLILAHQLIAAELNRAAGAQVAADLAAAQAWMTANGDVLPYGVRSTEATALATALAAYNEGATGPGHCD